ncbi:DUF4230 domain-containing protein [Echinicola strongylocentroti]|uniref:DUF4230 domain-containing protein n=1 Tax=Echinicola strongylocentroti TaxID=1795355 RepID=A0A2Z4IN15_9BACT|nr:DUF4230 domain-containing protein [Echinicola strongylocentroti]AWW32119.1 DUF4230 domain-containing protein [Echinicola strongylocentroti]
MKCCATYWSWLLVMVFLSGCKKDDRAMVVGKIQQASDLATTEFLIDKVVFGTKTKKLLFLDISQARFLAYSKASVKTGVDLSSLSAEDVTIKGEMISLKLPPIEVVNFSYPPASFREDSLISDTKAFLNTIRVRDQEEFFRLAELDIRSNLQYMGIVKTSQQHTRKMFETLLKSLGYREIYIAFKSDDLLIPQVNLLEEPDQLVNP